MDAWGVKYDHTLGMDKKWSPATEKDVSIGQRK